MGKFKRIMALMMITTLTTFLFMGCKSKEEDLKGMYVESEISIPEEVDWISDIRLLDGGEHRNVCFY